jgi:hypothetical protein
MQVAAMALQHVALSHVMADSSGSSMSDAAATERYRDLFQWAVSLLQNGVINGLCKGTPASVPSHLARTEFGRDPIWQYSSLQQSQRTLAPVSGSTEDSVLACSSPALLAYLQLAAQEQQQQQSPKQKRLQRPLLGSVEDLNALHAWVSSLQEFQEAENPLAAAAKSKRRQGGTEELDTLQLLHAFAALDDTKSKSEDSEASSSCSRRMLPGGSSVRGSSSSSSTKPGPVRSGKPRVSWADSCDTPATPPPVQTSNVHPSSSSYSAGLSIAGEDAAAGVGERRRSMEVLPAFRAWALLGEEQNHQRREQQHRRHQQQEYGQQEVLLTSSHIPCSAPSWQKPQQQRQHQQQQRQQQVLHGNRSTTSSSSRQSFSTPYEDCNYLHQNMPSRHYHHQQQQQQPQQNNPLARASAPASWAYSGTAATAGGGGGGGEKSEELSVLRYLVGLRQQRKQQQQEKLEQKQQPRRP